MNGVNIGTPIDVQPITDDRLLTLGTDGDGVIVLRSTVLDADTALTGVLVNTVEAQAIAANSVMIANVTSNGDIAMYVNKGGNSQMALWLDGSSGDTAIMAASGASVDHYIAGVKVLDHSSAAFAFQEATTISGVRAINGDGAGNVNIYSNAAVTDATERSIILNVLNATADAWLDVMSFVPSTANPLINMNYGLRHFFTTSVTAAGQTLNADPGSNIITAANAQAFTATGIRLAIPAITPVANGSGITLTGLSFSQGAISNVADSEAITVTQLAITGAAGVALETGIYTWRGINITIPDQAANAAVNVAAGITITGGAKAGDAAATMRGLDITMAADGDTAIRCNMGEVRLLNTSGTSTLTIENASIAGNTRWTMLPSTNGASSDLVWYEIGNAGGNAARMYLRTAGVLSLGTAPYATQVAGSLGVAGGVMIGANSLNNLIDDAANGAGSTPMYIGNAVILVGNSISFGPAAPASITVVNGQITAIS